jgi:hypothetical protein
LSANFASSSFPTGPSTTRNACSRPSNWNGSEIASSSGTVRDRNAMPTQIICSVPARTFCTFSAAPPSCMAGNTSTVNAPPPAFASSSRNMFIATLEECSVAKLPASRHLVCAFAPSVKPSSTAADSDRQSMVFFIVISLVNDRAAAAAPEPAARSAGIARARVVREIRPRSTRPRRARA